MRLVVIGAGMMGRNYLRAAKAASIPIAAIIDSNPEYAARAAVEFGCKTMRIAHAADIDAAVIAVPTAFHAAVAAPLLQDGIHCLVEKPFVATESEGLALMNAAALNSAVLQVGHIERFNPGVEALIARAIPSAEITALTAQRRSPASARVTDISVVADLMVHDLDIVLALKPLPVTKIEATGDADNATATLTFSDGAVATLTASRVAQSRVRTLDIAAGSRNYHLDYIAKSLLTSGAPAQNESYTGDALAAELGDFIGCIEHRRRPRVTADAALAVMKLVWRIEAALGGTA